MRLKGKDESVFPFPIYRFAYFRHASDTGITVGSRIMKPAADRIDGIYFLRKLSAVYQHLGPRADRRAERLHQNLVRAKGGQDRKSTRLNSSHQLISYAVFC